MKWALRSGLLALFAVLLAGNVKADTVFSYSVDVAGTPISFDLPEFPNTIAGFDFFPDEAFTVAPLNLMINGVASSDTLAFYSAGLWGGAFADVTNEDAFPGLMGDQLYTGSEDDPQMLPPASFALTTFGTATIPPGTEIFMLDVTPVSTAEPSSLLLLFTGLFALVLLRKRGIAVTSATAKLDN